MPILTIDGQSGNGVLEVGGPMTKRSTTSP